MTHSIATLQGDTMVTTEGRYMVLATLVRDTDEALYEWQRIIDEHRLTVVKALADRKQSYQPTMREIR
jgi:hypothetical protein